MTEQLGPEALTALYEHSPDGIFFTAPDGRVLAANPAACRILKHTEAEICALGRHGLVDPADERWQPMLDQRARTGHVHGVARMLRGDGAVIETELSAQIFKDSDGEARTCTVIRDVTERVRMERELTAATERLRELALTDELTGLRNRRGFITAATQLLELADRQLATLSVLFVDLDELKELNDGHGHPAGDAALRAVARAVTDALRRTDVVARIGGDEFAALALSMDESSRATIERRIRSFLRAPETVLTVGQRITVSIGWAERAPLGAQSVEDLIVEADQAMYRKKATNKD